MALNRRDRQSVDFIFVQNEMVCSPV